MRVATPRIDGVAGARYTRFLNRLAETEIRFSEVGSQLDEKAR
jgi:hypothetical protein